MAGDLRATRATSRMHFIDACRGFSMAFVCLSHFRLFYFADGRSPQVSNLIFHMVLPSTPTFMLISSVLVGVLSRELGERWPSLRDKLIDRGLFLLVPGHLLVRLGHWFIIRSAPPGSHWLLITDTIGVCLVAGTLSIGRLRRNTRLMAGAAIVALSWFAYLRWAPHGGYALLFKDYLIGEHQSAATGVVFPILPWLGYYLVGISLGEYISRWRQRYGRAAPHLLGLGLASMFAGVLLHGSGRVLHSSAWHALVSAGQKFPPGPGFLLFSSGCALLMVALLEGLEMRGYLTRLIGTFATLGRNSLVVFIVQFFVYYWGLHLFPLPYTPLWPLIFLGSLAFNLGIAWAWERYFGNRYLTVGFPWRRQAQAQVTAVDSRKA
ncbi:MAG: heparan-alpha-glucosaminide N-acetyltransferase domain-containing protein [Polyangiaceae bacterium]